MGSFSKSARRVGRKIDPAKAQCPDLIREGLNFYLLAFFDLDTERSHSMGWMRIPWTSLLVYADEYELTGDQREDFFYYMQEMDKAHIDKLDERREAEKNKGGK